MVIHAACQPEENAAGQVTLAYILGTVAQMLSAIHQAERDCYETAVIVLVLMVLIG